MTKRELIDEATQLRQRIAQLEKNIAELIRSDRTKKAENFKQLFIDLPDAIFISRLGGENRGEIIDVNPAAERQTGHLQQELIGMNILDILAADPFHIKNLEANEEELKAGNTVQVTEKKRRKDGSEYWTEVLITAMNYGDEKVAVSVNRDITAKKQSEEALRRSEDRYRYFIEHVNDGIWCFEAPERISLELPSAEKVRRSFDAVCIDCNTTYAAMYGATREQLIGKKLIDTMPPNPENIAYLTAFYENGCRIDDAESREINLDQNEKWFLNSMFAEIVDGKLIRAWGRQSDITERKQAEQARREFEERQNAILHTMPVILYSAQTPSPNSATWMTENVYRITGYSPEPFLTIANFWDDHIHPDDLAEVLNAYKVIRTGKPVNMEYRWRCSDGSYRWFMDHVISVQTINGGQVEYFGIWLDITERKRTEQALLISEERYRLATAATGQMIYDYDTNSGQINWAGSIISITGYSDEEFQNKNIDDWERMIHPEDREYALKKLEEAERQHSAYHVEYRFQKKDGQYVYIEDNGVFLIDQQGKSNRMIGAMKDITDQKRIGEQLLQAQKMESVGRLAGGVAHDFNNLLTVISGYTEMLKIQLATDQAAIARLTSIHQAAGRAAELTQQLLAFSRKQILRPKVFNLNDTLTDTIKMLQRLIGEDIQLFTSLTQEKALVLADPNQIVQVVMNLVVNARDAMPNGGAITLETSLLQIDEDFILRHPEAKPGKYVMLAVSDTGSGMSKDIQRRIFEPFFTTKELGKGTGLGLATVYGIVKQSEGFIWVYSEPGLGASFKVYLPFYMSREEILEEEDLLPVQGGQETILLVEDEKGVREMMGKILSSYGFKVLEAENADHAMRLESSFNQKIHIMVTDVVMPRMNGRDLAEQLLQKRSDMHVLFISGYTDKGIVHQGVLDADMQFLQKPFRPQELVRKVREILDSK